VHRDVKPDNEPIGLTRDLSDAMCLGDRIAGRGSGSIAEPTSS